MPDDTAPTVIQRPILHLPPKAKLNGTGVVVKPSGEVRMDDVVEELKNPPSPEQEG